MATNTDSYTGLHWLTIALVSITGVIHLGLGIADIGSPMGISFLLAGLGFIGALILFFRGYNRRILYLVGIPYVGLQIVFYLVINWPNHIYLEDGSIYYVGVLDKVIQLVLIMTLIVLYRTESQSQTTH